ncbi:hypothetical protein [Methanolapillus ohkumae]|uniref:PEGA domain-containing protein n=1 Tax=Methanolapillus ohkumae TaxID=3028298 RepID=A0AA96V9D1_9EURY|nr:hypothetical protein MsAm2_14830 [Methanosarcinaceae archaeon Am2]
MKNRNLRTLGKLSFVFVLLFLLVLPGAGALGGDQGTIMVNCNVNGAIVQLLDSNGSVEYTGTIQNGYAAIPVFTTGSPMSEAVISADGYNTAVVPVIAPAAGQTTTISVSLSPTDDDDDDEYTGENIAFIEVDCNVEGAFVQLVNINGVVVYTGTIHNGYVLFPIYIPATPVYEVLVSASGYYNQTVPIVQYPMDTGQVVTVIATLTPISSPPPGNISTYIVNCNVDGAKVSLVNSNGQVAYTGFISAGSVSINVYSDNTTISKIIVEAPGYNAETVPITSSNRPAPNGSSTFNVELTSIDDASSSSSSTWIWILIGVVVIIIAGAGIYYFYTTSKSK